MRHAHIFTLLSTAVLFQVATAAPSLDSTPVDKGIHHRYHSDPAHVAEVQGVYTLSDGRILRVSVEQNKLYAAVGDRKEELTPVGDNVYVTRDASMKLTFEPHAFYTDLVLAFQPEGIDITKVASR